MANPNALINRLRELDRQRSFYARLFTIAWMLALLAGCSTDPVLLRHPQTGKTAQCGPYSATKSSAKIAAVELERGCIADYQRQGYERVME
jgi:hypothetical protein